MDFEKSEVRAHQMARKLRRSGLTPQKSELSSHQMAPGGVVTHSSSWTLAAYEPHEVLLPRPFGLCQSDPRPPSLHAFGFFSGWFANTTSSLPSVLLLLWQTTSVDAEGFFGFQSLWYWIPGPFFSQASSIFFVRTSSWDVVELSQRVLNFVKSSLPDKLPFEGRCLLCRFETDYLQC